MAAARKSRYSTLHGLAKAVGLDHDGLKEYVYRETGRASLTELTEPELWRLERSLGSLKDSTLPRSNRKRTDEGGNADTEAQRRKMYAICRAMNRKDPERMVNRMAMRMFGTERQEWLNPYQCQKLIQALLAMAERPEESEAK